MEANQLTGLVSIITKPLVIPLLVNNLSVPLELDTGSSISTISFDKLREIANVQIRPTSKRAKGYGQANIRFHGEVDLSVQLNNIKFVHTFLVVNQECVSLLGRDLCHKLHICFSLPVKRD